LSTSHPREALENKLRCIDVEFRCLVSPQQIVRYAFLSYVWGADKVLTAMKNIHELEILGAFFDKLEIRNYLHKAIGYVIP